MTTNRTRRPSMAQRPILATIADLGGVAVQHSDVLDRMAVWAGVGSWVAIASAGWVTVDRRTPDNRGGILADYRYTLTVDGWAAIDRTPPAERPPLDGLADLPWDDGNACHHCATGATHTDAEHRAAALAAHDTEAGYEGDAYGWECECGAQGHGLRTLDDARDQADAHRRETSAAA